MKPLSKEASAALSALEAKDPTATDEARVRKNLERALGVGIPVATVAAATTAQAASVAALSVGAKAIVFVLAVGVASVMTVTISNSRSTRETALPIARSAPVEIVKAPEPIAPEPTPAAPDEVKPVAPVRARAPLPPVVIAPTPTPTPEPQAAPDVPPPPPPITEATIELEVEANFPGCDGATELRSAVSARKLLNADRPEEAVWLLGAYQRRCPSGRWSDEAWTVRMAGLCRLGRNSEVTGLLQWFSAEYPRRRAAVMSELRSFCSAEVLRHGEASGD